MTEINLKDELWENDLDISDLKWFIYHGHDEITLSAMSQEVYDRLDEWNKPKYCLITDSWIWVWPALHTWLGLGYRCRRIDSICGAGFANFSRCIMRGKVGCTIYSRRDFYYGREHHFRHHRRGRH